MNNVHPGQLILQALEKVGMTQKELATRVGVSEKHISTVISGDRPISTTFAQKLGYVIKDSKYWLEAQANYDVIKQSIIDRNNITEEELLVYSYLKDIISTLIEKNLFIKGHSIPETILKLRTLYKVSNLSLISKISYNAAYRAQISKNAQVNPYVLYAWQSLCELVSEKILCEKVLDIEKLKSNIPNIKKLMFKSCEEFVPTLQNIFSSCGISFSVVKNFKGAPVQGFIKQCDNKVILCLTNRRKRADTFWFTLFHEIGHILNGDIKNRFVDFELADSSIEIKADEFAKNELIAPEEYKSFVQNNIKFSRKIITEFAKKIGVAPFIVTGRLQKDQIIDWSEHTDLITKYEFDEGE